MPIAAAVGEAAGTAAAMCIAQEQSVTAVDVAKLRERLRRRGANIGGE